jgi:parvulin-like peptidyl-prolyl isomerase
MDRLDKDEDFALVASQVSSNTVTGANGGELGWFMTGQLATRYNPQFEETAFSLQPGAYSQPITSTMGWQIIRVTERGVHPLNETQLLTKQAEGYSKWLEESKKAGVQILWKPEMAPPDPFLEQQAGG